MLDYKFRAWDYEKSQMFYDFALVPIPALNNMWRPMIIETPCDSVRSSLVDFQDNLGDYSLIDWTNRYARVNYYVMSSLDLNDIDGCRVFEKDIVNIIDINEKVLNTGVVEMSKKFHAWVLKTREGAILFSDIVRYFFDDKCQNIHIVGNIFENPKLY